MKKLFILAIASLFAAGCNDNYISRKREGMKPYSAEPDSKQSQEDKED